jgi:hypothetical protein
MMDNSAPEAPELSLEVMLADIQDLTSGSLTILVNEYRDAPNTTIEDAIEHLQTIAGISDDVAQAMLEVDRIVQITCLPINDDDEEVTVWSHTLEDAVRQAYFALHMKLGKEGA